MMGDDIYFLFLFFFRKFAVVLCLGTGLWGIMSKVEWKSRRQRERERERISNILGSGKKGAKSLGGKICP